MQEKEKQFSGNNVDWYEVDNSGEVVISLKDKLIPKIKPILIGLGIIIVIALISLFVYEVVKFFYNASEDKQITENTNLYIEACQNEQDVQKCVSNAALRLTQETGNSKYCDELTGVQFDSCLATSALTSRNVDNCQKIADSTIKAQCNDAVIALSMPSDHTYEACADYVDEQKQEQCEQTWVFDTILKGECDYPQISTEMCEIGAMISDAIAKQNPDLCSLISDYGMLEYCMERTLPGDRDFDGLDAAEEESIGTSDTNTDTDGDGYSDKEEVMTGHDPLK
jgi:hypothetical protein